MLRTALRIVQRCTDRIDAEVVVNRREDVFLSDRPSDCRAGGAVGFTDDDSAAHSSAGENRGADLRPVMPAAALRIDARSPAKLAPGNDRHIVQSAALFKVGDQRRQPMINDRQDVSHPREIRLPGS